MDEEKEKQVQYAPEKKSLALSQITIAVLLVGILGFLTVYTAADKFIQYKQGSTGGITVTGSSNRNFTSDLIVWRGSFSRTSQSTKEAYELLKKDADIIAGYLKTNGVAESDFVFSSIDTIQNYSYIYNENGNIQQQIPDGFTLSQSLTISSEDVNTVEGVSRDITKLIDSGVIFISNQPEYFYTKLDELKLEMIADATDNARQRAEIVAENANSRVGKLTTANLGVFQITAQNSSADEYSYGGTFNTWSKDKTASITVKLFYEVK